MHEESPTSLAIRLEDAAGSSRQRRLSPVAEGEMDRLIFIAVIGGGISVLVGAILAFCTAGTSNVLHVTFPPFW